MSDEKFEAYWKDRCAKRKPYSTVDIKYEAQQAWRKAMATAYEQIIDARNKFQCAARGCDGCTVCKEDDHE